MSALTHTATDATDAYPKVDGYAAVLSVKNGRVKWMRASKKQLAEWLRASRKQLAIDIIRSQPFF